MPIEDYGMTISISKMKDMVVGRKSKKIDIQVKGESIEQVDSFKYLGCNISSNMNCCQKVKQRIAMAKEAFNRKRNIFCRPLEKKKLRKRLTSCPINSFIRIIITATYLLHSWIVPSLGIKTAATPVLRVECNVVWYRDLDTTTE